jgi:hypothetical protein
MKATGAVAIAIDSNCWRKTRLHVTEPDGYCNHLLQVLAGFAWQLQ